MFIVARCWITSAKIGKNKANKEGSLIKKESREWNADKRI